MKKARIMVIALGFVALLATSFAFRVKMFSSHFIFTGKLHSGACTTKLKGAAIMSGSPVVAASTVSITKGCPDVFTVAIND